MEFFIEHIGKKSFGILYYWGHLEFSKCRGQIHLHLVGIEKATSDGGIQQLMYLHRNDKNKQVKLLADWARKTFNMTAEVNEKDINANEDKATRASPYSLRFFEIKDGSESNRTLSFLSTPFMQ